jgi:hypothetical protein
MGPVLIAGKYYDDATVPFALEVYERRQNERRRDAYLMALGVGTATTIVLSAMVYLAGWIIAWVMRGFRRTA